MTERIDVHPEMIKWALLRSGKEDHLIEKVPQIKKWLNGDAKPTFKQLENLAKSTYTPFGYFFLDHPPKEYLPVPHFRTVKEEDQSPSANLLEMVNIMKRRQEWMKEYLIDNGHEKLDFVGKYSYEVDPIDAAQDIKKVLSMDSNWYSTLDSRDKTLKYLIDKAESIGILVMVSGVVGSNTHRPLDVDEFRGFVLIDEYCPLLFLNGADGKAAQIFTLAHELAHIWLGKSAIFDLENLQPSENKIEKLCDKIAAEFLVPKSLFLREWQDLLSPHENIAILSFNFKVSELVIARRSLDLKKIDIDTFYEFYELYRERLAELKMKNKLNPGGNYYHTQAYNLSSRFSRAVAFSALAGNTVYTEACRLVGLKPKTFKEFTERMGLS